MRAVVVKLASALLALVASQAATAAVVTNRTTVRIEVPSASNLQFLTLWVAVGAGLFQEEGLEPKVLVAPGPRMTGDMLFKGDADVALLPPPMFLGMMAENKPVRLFASLLANEPINLVVRKDIADARKLSGQASLHARLLAIRGLRVGLAGEVTPRLRALFAFGGMDADKDIRRVVVAGPDQVQAFIDGKVDGLFAHTPYLETTLVEHDAVLLVETSGGEVPALAEGQVHALATTRDLAAAKPEVMEGVARAIARAQRLIHSDSKAAVDALVSYGRAGSDQRLLKAIVAVYGPAVPPTPQISIGGVERDATLYPAHPRAPDFSRVNAKDFIAPAFAEHAGERK